jgi:hypothetical protein
LPEPYPFFGATYPGVPGVPVPIPVPPPPPYCARAELARNAVKQIPSAILTTCLINPVFAAQFAQTISLVFKVFLPAGEAHC